MRVSKYRYPITTFILNCILTPYIHDRPFVRSVQMIRNKLCRDANNAVGLQKQRNSYQCSWWNRESTVNCKLECYVKPMKDPLGVSPSKGNQGTKQSKEKISFDLGGNRTHDLRIRFTVTLPTELQGRTDLSGSIPTEVKRIFSLPHVVP